MRILGEEVADLNNAYTSHSTKLLDIPSIKEKLLQLELIKNHIN